MRLMRRSLSQSIADVRRRMEAGDLLLAFDVAAASLQRFPDDVTLKHLAALSLARAGASDRALELFRAWKLDQAPDSHISALEARLAKDRALALSESERAAALVEAADIYLKAARGGADPYHRINAASLFFLAGRREEARKLAAALLPDAAGEDYWSIATRAEAKILIGERDAAAVELDRAARATDAAVGARASTRRQLRLLLAAEGARSSEVEAFLAPLAPAVTLCVSSSAHGWQTPIGNYDIGAFRKAARRELATLSPGAAFIALGGPAETIVAEAALSAGVELTVVLPAEEARMTAEIAAMAEPSWARRLKSVCRRASRIAAAFDDPEGTGAGGAHYAARVAAGLAALRARDVDGEVVELALSSAASDMPGASDCNGRWRQVALGVAGQTPRASEIGGAELPCRAVVFADLPGFSKLPDRLLPVFWEVVMGAVGDVVKAAGERVAVANTWGDAVHLVVDDVRSAAEICLAMQRRLAAIGGEALERDEAPTMRIGAHYGPMREGFDPVTLRRTFFGRALARAARIEPVAPPGAVYVTEAFAAILYSEAGTAFDCTYVGQVPLAKGYGTFRMYDLSPAR